MPPEAIQGCTPSSLSLGVFYALGLCLVTRMHFFRV